MRPDMLKTNPTSPILIAPCGINCRLCRAYARDRNPCSGCRDGGTHLACKIKNCKALKRGKYKYCFSCTEYPCATLVHLDKRYRTRYATSPIDNLKNIKEAGIRAFVEKENKKWTCPQCRAMLCMHQPGCLSCGYVWHKSPE